MVKQVREKRSYLVVLTRDLAERLEREANRLTTSRSLLIRRACERLLEDLEEGKEVVA